MGNVPNIAQYKIDHSKKTLTEQLKSLRTNNRSYSTRSRYRSAGRSFVGYLSENYATMHLKNIQPKHIEGYLQHMIDADYSMSTIKTNLSAVRFIHGMIDNPRYKTDKLPTNSDMDVDKRCSKNEVTRALTETEINNFRTICKELDRPDVLLAGELARTLGLRLNEVSRIKKNNVEDALRTGILKIGKGQGTKNGKYREIPVSKEARTYLLEANSRVERGEYIIRPEVTKDRHIINDSITGFVNRHRDKFVDKSIYEERENEKGETVEYRRNLRFHSFRYTYANDRYKEYIENGYTDKQAKGKISKEMGHERVEITSRYLS